MRRERATEIAGRAAELAALDEALESCRTGRSRLAVVTGEAGIGKTALAEAFTADATSAGAAVAWGRGWESGWAPPFWPWTQVVRVLGERFGEHVGVASDEWLARLLPELRKGRLDEGITEESRFFLFDAVRVSLLQAAQVQPLVIVLDDLHAADVPSLLLTEFLAGHPGEHALLIVATFRPREAHQRADAAEIVGRIERQSDVRLRLGPLDREEIGHLVEIETGHAPDDGLVAVVSDTSEGHPLFARELLHVVAHPDTSGRVDRPELPRTVRDLIDRRLEVLPEDIRDVLATAAVIGRDVPTELVGEIHGADASSAAFALAEREEIVITTDRGTSFSHILLRDGLYDGLDPPERAVRHQRVAETIERQYAQDLDAHVPALAHHYLLAPEPTRSEKGLVYAVAAGARARRLLAYEEAAELYRRAVDVATAAGAPAAERCELLVALGEALVRGGRLPDGRPVCAEAFELADQLGDFRLMARAAEWFAGLYVEGGVVNAEAVRLLERALIRAGPEVSDAKALVLGRLAHELTFDEDAVRRWTLAREAIAVARQTGSTRTLAETLTWAYNALSNHDIAEEALTVATENARLAADLGDIELEVRARASRTNQLLELGRIREFYAEVGWLRARVGNIGAPMLRWIADFDPVIALMRGELDRATAAAEEALNRSRGESNVLAGYVGQRAQVAWERGELMDMEALLLMGGDGRPQTRPLLRAMLAAARAQSGRHEEARVEVDNVLTSLERPGRVLDVMGLVTLGWLAETVTVTSDAPNAARLVELLQPYDGRHVSLLIMRPTVYLGTTCRHLGNLAAVLGRFDDAEMHHRRALGMHADVEAPVYVGYTQVELAAVLRQRGRAGDASSAAELHAEGMAAAQRMGLRWLATLGARLEEASVTTPPAADARLVCEGDFWAVSYAGHVARIRDAKGIRYLERLLRQPGTEIHSLDLAGDGTSIRETGDAGALLDDRAKAQYRARIEDLEEEMREAEEFHDDGRAAKARLELETIAGELGRALGLGGRDRRFGSDAERARVNVTRHIKGAVAKIAEASPALGRHLAATVRTGHFCCYEPAAAEVRVDWHLGRGDHRSQSAHDS